MSVIVKADDSWADSASAEGAWTDGWQRVWQQVWVQMWAQVDAHVRRCGAHPSRTVLLLPFFQLQTLARRSAAQAWSQGFLPRIETTKSWQQRIAGDSAWLAQGSDETDISGDMAIDSLRARAWLLKAGLGEQAAVLTPWLVEAAQQLAGVVSAMAPDQRPDWAAQMRLNLLTPWQGSMPTSASALNSAQHFASYEMAVQRIALEWAAASRYASDVLFEALARDVDALIVVRGVQQALANNLAGSLAEQLSQRDPERVLIMDLPAAPAGPLYEHVALDGQDEAQRAAACVLAHLAAGRVPVALPAIDRLATRRISALLLEQGVALSDETGWRLSTTRLAASLMSVLRAAHPLASLDERLDALKQALGLGGGLGGQAEQLQLLVQLETTLRGQNPPIAGINTALSAIKIGALWVESTQSEQEVSVQAWLAKLRRPRSVAQWLVDLREALQISGQWQLMRQSPAGLAMLEALHLVDLSSLQEPTPTLGIGAGVGIESVLSLAEFTQWVQAVLEAVGFKPPGLVLGDAQAQQLEALQAQQELPDIPAQVVVLPLAQLAARPFAAVVMAGCDELHLPAVPALQGLWTGAQRQLLGMPSRAQLAQEQQAIWQRAMQMPWVDVLWSASQAGSEQALQASPLLLAHQLVQPDATIQTGQDARLPRQLVSLPQTRPAPVAAALAQQQFSASSYADVRACPYRYYALRLLGLHEASELQEGLDKRDFGSWLHGVLSDFHEQRPREHVGLETSSAADAQLLDHCAAKAAQAQFGDDASFIPFAAAWPQMRDAYLLWLAEHESQGWRFEVSELKAQRQLGGVSLQGRLDRLDVLAGSAARQRMVMDYKTESTQSLRERVSDPLEDTQLAFYAALLGSDVESQDDASAVQAAYLGLGEKEAKLLEQPKINEVVPLLLEGIAQDAQRIAAGHALPALGEGKVCDYCAARGLCRKDFWAPEPMRWEAQP